jgi:hypothetical protein
MIYSLVSSPHIRLTLLPSRATGYVSATATVVSLSVKVREKGAHEYNKRKCGRNGKISQSIDNSVDNSDLIHGIPEREPRRDVEGTQIAFVKPNNGKVYVRTADGWWRASARACVVFLFNDIAWEKLANEAQIRPAVHL